MKFQPVTYLADGGKVRIRRNPHPTFHIILQQAQRHPLAGFELLVTDEHTAEGPFGSFILDGCIGEIVIQR